MTLPQIRPNHPASCHCGAVQFTVTLVAEGLATARRCDCSFCRRRGAIAVTTLPDGVKILTGQDKLTLYQFGTNTAQHHFCAVCGIYIYHRRRSNPNELGVNVACLEGLNPRDLGDVEWSDGVNHPSDARP